MRLILARCFFFSLKQIRYLVASEDRYRCALALALSNMYVRATISQKLGIHQLPLVSFFILLSILEIFSFFMNLVLFFWKKKGYLDFYFLFFLNIFLNALEILNNVFDKVMMCESFENIFTILLA